MSDKSAAGKNPEAEPYDPYRYWRGFDFCLHIGAYHNCTNSTERHQLFCPQCKQYIASDAAPRYL